MAAATVLVVDDSPTGQKIVCAALAAKGYHVVTAADGDAALAMVAAVNPRVVVLDVVMPKKNGYQVCRLLKESPATAGIKVLLLTSKNQPSDRFWGMKQGADAYLTKPFDDAELVGTVAGML